MKSQDRKREAKLCDNCKFYSYNMKEIQNKSSLRAWCSKQHKDTTPWNGCSKFSMVE